MQLDFFQFPKLVTPDQAVLTASVGVGLIFVEFNRPGRVAPGALGLFLTLLATSSLLRLGVQPWALLLLAACVAVYLANLWQELPLSLLALATLAAIPGLRYLVPDDGHGTVRLWVAVLCGGTLGSLSAALTRVAHRARRSKALD